MPAAKSTCSHCILDGTPLSFDRAAKLEYHCQQKHHKIVQQAYERGLQEGCNSLLAEGMIATHLQPVSVEVPPQNAVETETAYAHGFQDGKAAEKAMHDTVIKAMLDSHTRDIEAAFKRGKEHSIVTAAPPTLPLLPTQVGRLQSDLQQEPYAQGVAAPQLQPALENTTKNFQPPAEQSPSDTSIWQLWQAWWHKRIQRRDRYSKYLQPGGSSPTSSIDKATVNAAPKRGSDTRTATRSGIDSAPSKFRSNTSWSRASSVWANAVHRTWPSSKSSNQFMHWVHKHCSSKKWSWRWCGCCEQSNPGRLGVQ